MSKKKEQGFMERLSKERVKSIFKSFAAEEQEWRRRGFDLDDKMKKLDKQMDRLRQERATLEKERFEETWFARLVEPLAKLMLVPLELRMGCKLTYEMLGPHGVTCAVSVHFYKVGVPEKQRFEGDNCVSITFRPGNLDIAELFIVDYTKNTGRYSPGTIGQINGMNYPGVPVKQDLDFILKYVR